MGIGPVPPSVPSAPVWAGRHGPRGDQRGLRRPVHRLRTGPRARSGEDQYQRRPSPSDTRSRPPARGSSPTSPTSCSAPRAPTPWVPRASAADRASRSCWSVPRDRHRRPHLQLERTGSPWPLSRSDRGVSFFDETLRDGIDLLGTGSTIEDKINSAPHGEPRFTRSISGSRGGRARWRM